MKSHTVASHAWAIPSRRWLLAAALAVLASQAGCATVTRGKTDEVWFESIPWGARVTLQPPTVDCVTPCAQELRHKQDYVVRFEKEGYVPAEVTVSSKFRGAGVAGFAGNVILGGLVGMGVDHATGANKVLQPNPVKVTLVPASAAATAAAATPLAVPALPAPQVAQCIQPALVDRESCLGRLRLGMAKAESVALLGTPDGTSRDQLTHRYGDRYLKFDATEMLVAIGDKP
jgi:hypothetical protein